MSQTSTIFFFVIIGFIVYITTKGELPKYLAILFGTVKPEQQQKQASDSGQSPSSIGGIAHNAQIGLDIASQIFG